MSGILTPGDLTSPTWNKLERHFEARIADLREQNDADLDDLATTKIRAKIATYMELLRLGEIADE